jgi:hypothetical protein
MKHNSEENYYSIKPTANVGRATVPADIGRHGGRPYVSARPKFLLRSDWTLAARGGAHMKLHEIQCHFREVLHEVSEFRRQRFLNSEFLTPYALRHMPCAFSYFPHSAFQLPNS